MIHIHLLTKKRFNVRQRIGGDVAFVRLLIGKRYLKGPNFDSSQAAQNVNFPISDVVNTKLTNFGTIENVGHTDGNNIRSVEDTIPLKTIEIIDQSLTMGPPIHVPLCMPLKTLKYRMMDCMVNNTLYTISITPFTQHPQMMEMQVCLGSYPSTFGPLSSILILHF